MTEELGWVDLEVRPDVTGFPSALSRGVSGPLDRVGRDGGNRLASGIRSSVARSAKSIVAPLAGVFATYQVVDFAKDAYAEAKDARKVGALTEQLIKQTGKAANVSANQVGRLSTAISNKVGIDDEAIQSGANLLLTFKNVRNEVGAGNKVFDRATKAAVDLSSIKGFGGLEGASKQLGKALNDPEKGISALAKAGVGFTDQQKEQIKTLVKSGDLLGAQKIVLKEVESQVGGAAAAQADAGDRISVAMGNIKEAIGTAALPAIDEFANYLTDKGVPAGKRFADFLTDDGIPAIRNFVDEAKPLARQILPAVGDALGVARDALKEAAPYAKDLVGAFNDMPDWAKKVIIGGGLSAFAANKFFGDDKGVGSSILSLVTRSKPLPVFVTNPGFGSDLPSGKPGTPAVPVGKPPTGLLAGVSASALKFAGLIGGGALTVGSYFEGQDNKKLNEGIQADYQAELGKRYQDSVRRTHDLSGLLLGPLSTAKSLDTTLDTTTTKADSLADLFGKPITPKINTGPANAALNGLEERLARILALAQNSTAVDSSPRGFGADRAGTGRAGPIFTGPINVQPHDYGDFMGQVQRRSQAANLGGRRQ